MTEYSKTLHTAIFTDPMRCGKSQLVLNVLEKNTASIFVTSSLSTQRSYEIRHIRHGLDMIALTYCT